MFIAFWILIGIFAIIIFGMLSKFIYEVLHSVEEFSNEINLDNEEELIIKILNKKDEVKEYE